MNSLRILIAGTQSGVDKTTMTLASRAAFTSRGRTVYPFKVSPDCLVPNRHRLATGRISHNLEGEKLG